MSLKFPKKLGLLLRRRRRKRNPRNPRKPKTRQLKRLRKVMETRKDVNPFFALAGISIGAI
jgi:hypothetical protein